MSVSQDTSAPAAGPGCGDKRRLVKTKTPGVFKRIDGDGHVVGYVAVIRVAGRQRKRNVRTYEAARRIKRESETDRDRGELQERTMITFLRFLDQWVERYRGQGRRGFRENTHPLRAALATAKREGLIRHNPAQGLALPHGEQVADEEDEVKVFSREQLSAVLAMAPERHKPLFELLASCGLRISEAIALQRLHLQLDPDEPEVCVRLAIVRERIERPKSKYGRREVRLPAPLAAKLRVHLAAQPDQDSTALAFPNESGGALDPNNLRRRVLKPLVEEVNVPWAGFHTFRHTFASLHLSRGTNLLQLSRALGHHSPAFTLTRYTHLVPGEEAPALEVIGP